MIEDIKEFLSNNSTMVLIAVVALVAIVGFFMFRRNTGIGHMQHNNTLPHDFEGMETMGSVCDMSSGMCQPPTHMSQMSQEEQEQMMQQQMQQMQQQQMQEQQMQEQQMQQQSENNENGQTQ